MTGGPAQAKPHWPLNSRPGCGTTTRWRSSIWRTSTPAGTDSLPALNATSALCWRPCGAAEPATWISWDWEKHYDGDARVTLPAEIVIVEGVGAAAAAARPMLDAVIWADSPEDERRARALERDGQTYEPYWDQWAAQEAELLACGRCARPCGRPGPQPRR